MLVEISGRLKFDTKTAVNIAVENLPHRLRRCAEDERGFTLPEVLVVVLLLGILAAIAIPSFFGLTESRRVESAANQLAADLRLAHSRATNQIGTASSVTLYPGRGPENVGPDYIIINGSNSQDGTFPGNVRISSPTTSPTVLNFYGSGGVNYNGEIRVKSGNTTEKILRVNSVTSNVEVLP